jgi:hypothetical protein
MPLNEGIHSTAFCYYAYILKFSFTYSYFYIIIVNYKNDFRAHIKKIEKIAKKEL